MKLGLQIIFFSIFPALNYAQESLDTSLVKHNYENVYNELNEMLNGKREIDFKRAVFITENAFLNNELKYEDFLEVIDNYKFLITEIIRSRNLEYDESDKKKISVYAAVFSLMQDTTKIMYSSTEISHFPFTYDFNDFTGSNNWTQMFVNKLLATHNGNCHSLPYLYKILVEELGEEAYLALAPNHIYIKLQSKKYGWYNTELTSGIFPIDAWLMASGYIHLSAIQNGIYMDTLSQKQSVALCLVDLAQGYEKKLGVENGNFIYKCCDTALEFYPNFINAMLVKAETKLNLIQDNVSSQSIVEKETKELEELYQKIHNLGFRKMPEQMYLEWLVSLKEEKQKYQNRKINFNQ